MIWLLLAVFAVLAAIGILWQQGIINASRVPKVPISFTADTCKEWEHIINKCDGLKLPRVYADSGDTYVVKGIGRKGLKIYKVDPDTNKYTDPLISLTVAEAALWFNTGFRYEYGPAEDEGIQLESYLQWKLDQEEALRDIE